MQTIKVNNKSHIQICHFNEMLFDKFQLLVSFNLQRKRRKNFLSVNNEKKLSKKGCIWRKNPFLHSLAHKLTSFHFSLNFFFSYGFLKSIIKNMISFPASPISPPKKKTIGKKSIFFNQSSWSRVECRSSKKRSLLMMGKFNFTVCFPSCYVRFGKFVFWFFFPPNENNDDRMSKLIISVFYFSFSLSHSLPPDRTQIIDSQLNETIFSLIRRQSFQFFT